VDLALLVGALALGVGAVWGTAGLTDAGVISKESLTSALALVCPLVTMCQYVAPIPIVLDAVKQFSAQSLPLQVFQSQAACNVLGIAYGIQITNSAVLVTNMFGLACQVVFLTTDHYVRASDTWIWYSIRLSALINCVLYVFATLTPINVLGHTITLFNIVLFAVPLAKLGSILRTKNASSIPTAMTIIALANNGVWSLYAIMIQDSVVLLPSLLGYLLSAFQVFVILWSKGKLPFDLGFLLLLSDCKTPLRSSSSAMKPPTDWEMSKI